MKLKNATVPSQTRSDQAEGTTKAINELRECARGGKRSAAGLGSGFGLAWGWALGGRGSLAGVSRALGLGVPTSPEAARDLPSSSGALRNRSSPTRPVACRVPRNLDFLGAQAWGGEEEFCPDSAAVGSKQAFSWVSPGKVAKLLFTCKNMLFIFQSLLVNLELAAGSAGDCHWFNSNPSQRTTEPIDIIHKDEIQQPKVTGGKAGYMGSDAGRWMKRCSALRKAEKGQFHFLSRYSQMDCSLQDNFCRPSAFLREGRDGTRKSRTLSKRTHEVGWNWGQKQVSQTGFCFPGINLSTSLYQKELSGLDGDTEGSIFC
ncbi:uncharacterized protein WM277_004178 [Molossus nigricans]